MTAAFHRALPEHVLGPLLEDDAKAVLLGAPSSNMEPSDYTSRIRAALCVWGAPPWLHRATTDWQAHTFFHVRHSERTCKLVSGVRPGDPLADLIFNACMTGFIKEMRECRIKEGLLVSMQDLDGNPLDQAGGPDDQGPEREVDLDGPTWVDDHAIFTVPQDPNDIVHNIRTIMVTLEAVAARHGFCLNTKKGKTECVITSLRGRASWQPRVSWIGKRTTPSSDMGTRASCGWSTATSIWARSTTSTCAEPRSCFVAQKRRVLLWVPSPGGFCETRSSPYPSDDKLLRPVLKVPFSRRQDGGRHRRNASSAFSMLPGP